MTVGHACIDDVNLVRAASKHKLYESAFSGSAVLDIFFQSMAYYSIPAMSHAVSLDLRGLLAAPITFVFYFSIVPGLQIVSSTNYLGASSRLAEAPVSRVVAVCSAVTIKRTRLRPNYRVCTALLLHFLLLVTCAPRVHFLSSLLVDFACSQ